MKTFYIGSGRSLPDHHDPFFVIGVKDDNCSLDCFLKLHPKLQVVKRWPDVRNIRYINQEPEIIEYDDDDEPVYADEEESHVLQPAILQVVA